MRACVCGCVSEFRETYRLCGQKHFREGKKVNTDLCSAISSRGCFPHKKKALSREKRRAGEKKKDFKMRSKEKQTRGSSPLSFLSRAFLCCHRKGDRMIVGHNRAARRWWVGGVGVRVGGDRLLNRPRRFYRFPLSPPWRTSDLSRREDEGETEGGGQGGRRR